MVRIVTGIYLGLLVIVCALAVRATFDDPIPAHSKIFPEPLVIWNNHIPPTFEMEDGASMVGPITIRDEKGVVVFHLNEGESFPATPRSTR